MLSEKSVSETYNSIKFNRFTNASFNYLIGFNIISNLANNAVKIASVHPRILLSNNTYEILF